MILFVTMLLIKFNSEKKNLLTEKKNVIYLLNQFLPLYFAIASQKLKHVFHNSKERR